MFFDDSAWISVQNQHLWRKLQCKKTPQETKTAKPIASRTPNRRKSHSVVVVNNSLTGWKDVVGRAMCIWRKTEQSLVSRVQFCNLPEYIVGHEPGTEPEHHNWPGLSTNGVFVGGGAPMGTRFHVCGKISYLISKKITFSAGKKVHHKVVSHILMAAVNCTHC